MPDNSDGPQGRRFTLPGFIAALPTPGGGSEPSPWRDIVRAIPWLLIVFIGMIARWSVTEITGLIALLIGYTALPQGGASSTAAAHGA
ncbi:Uncharacterised protein [Amycolatopsis camponoti]|uniref:Uncharacterized protein n=1 Tax=Amycolatopsis camponoti TaxID=2606593 RepID=A0A6I8LZA1_9PSEU|nr:hypothetical protein [Amycolatopsis camponoti]VVJ22635.1 Uncharacterised protein [Amycolatopsis camponoti]